MTSAFSFSITEMTLGLDLSPLAPVRFIAVADLNLTMYRWSSSPSVLSVLSARNILLSLVVQ